MKLANISTYENDFGGGAGGGYRARSYSETRGGGAAPALKRSMSGAFSKPLPTSPGYPDK